MKIKHVLLGLATAFSFSVSAFAAPVSFNIDGLSLNKGVGYGAGSEELLDVTFSTPVAPGSFSLELGSPATASKTFDISLVNFKEVCVNPGGCTKPPSGNGNETKNLNVELTFHFVSPLGGDKLLTVIGSANPGPAADNSPDTMRDYWLSFGDALEYTFGDGGKFSLDVNDLTFYGNGSQTLTATLTLLAAPKEATPPPTNDVPEPASLALMGLGLAGLAARGKRRKA